MPAKKQNKRFLKLQKAFYNTIGFTFIELIIVVTIIAILSVSAWTALTGETDKARDAKRLSDLSTIQQALEQYYIRNSFYPQPAARNDQTQRYAWGYRPDKEAVASCVTKFDSDVNQIVFDETYCGGDIKDLEGIVIGWKGVINEDSGKNSISMAKGEDTEVLKPFSAEYIQNIGSDPKLSGDTDFRAKGVGDYIYATYRGPLAENDYKNGATQYQLATTLERGGPDERESYIIGNYTQKRGKLQDPYSLIGSGENVLINEQKKGQNNDKVVNKTDKQKSVELKSKIDSFEDSIKDLQDKTAVSADAQKFLEKTLGDLAKIDEDLSQEDFTDFDSTKDDLNGIRQTMKEAINRFYRDAASEIYENIKTAIREDKSEQIKEEALDKTDDLNSVIEEINRSAKNSRRFASKLDELNVRKDIDSKLDILKNEDLEDLKDILNEAEFSVNDIIGEGFEDSIGIPQDINEFSTNGFTNENEDVTSGESGGELTSDVMKEIDNFIETIDNIKKSLFDVDTEKKEFNVEYSDILLDLSDLGNNIKDIKNKVENMYADSNRFGSQELAELSEDLSQESNSRKRLELILKAEQQITGGVLKVIQVEFDENILGEDAGQPGVARDPSNPLSPYSGIPYPLEISG